MNGTSAASKERKHLKKAQHLVAIKGKWHHNSTVLLMYIYKETVRAKQLKGKECACRRVIASAPIPGNWQTSYVWTSTRRNSSASFQKHSSSHLMRTTRNWLSQMESGSLCTTTTGQILTCPMHATMKRQTLV